jgi:hypothetical protein
MNDQYSMAAGFELPVLGRQMREGKRTKLKMVVGTT